MPDRSISAQPRGAYRVADADPVSRTLKPYNSSPLPGTKVEQMTTADVATLLRDELGYAVTLARIGQYAAKVEQIEIDGDTLADIVQHGNLAAVLGIEDVVHQTKLRVAAGKIQRKHALAPKDDNAGQSKRPRTAPKKEDGAVAASPGHGSGLLAEATKRLQPYEATGYGTLQVGANDAEIRRVQILAAQEVLRREGLDATFQQPMPTDLKTIPDEDEDGSFATCKLCFGFPITFKNLKEQLLLGRRWYKDGLHASQDLDEVPHCQNFSEFHTVKDIEDFWDGGPGGSGPRPAGSKAWNGPSLKHYTEFALKDMLKRAGVALDAISLIYTGFEDNAGEVALLGCSISGSIPQHVFDASLVGLSGKGQGDVAAAAAAAAVHSKMPTFGPSPFAGMIPMSLLGSQVHQKHPIVAQFEAAAVGGQRSFTDDPSFGIEAVSSKFVTDLLQLPAPDMVALTEHLQKISQAVREKIPFLAKPSERMHPNAEECVYLHSCTSERKSVALSLHCLLGLIHIHARVCTLSIQVHDPGCTGTMVRPRPGRGFLCLSSRSRTLLLATTSFSPLAADQWWLHIVDVDTRLLIGCCYKATQLARSIRV